MNAYIYRAALYCEPCAKLIRADLDPAEDSDRFPQGPYPNGGGEADSPQHCDRCLLFLGNPLTSDGIEYTRQQIRKANPWRPGISILEWCAFYGGLLCECATTDLTDADCCVACSYRHRAMAAVNGKQASR